MSSGEKILETIRMDSKKNVEEIRERSRAKCDEISNKARVRVREINAETEQKKAEQEVRLRKSYQSKIELEKRNTLLKAKRAEIDRTVQATLQYMKNLPTNEYFALIEKLALTLPVRQGVLFFGEKDLKRVPKDFIQRLTKQGFTVTLSDQPDRSIDSGFLLKNGDIEDNMSFDSLIADHREAIEDLINRELFRA